MEDLLGSPSHRANILREGVRELGVALIQIDGGYYFYWVQLFKG